MTEIELNEQLYNAVTASIIDLSLIENLLKLGADPLGSYYEPIDGNCVIAEVFCEVEGNEDLSNHIIDVMDLFYKYGMKISSELFENDNTLCLEANPLWDLAFNSSESGLKILKSLLDHNIDSKSVEIMTEHILIDMCLLNISKDEIEKCFYERDIYSIKMIMFAASYDHILKNSKYLRKEICYDKNNSDTAKFRNWDDFDYHIDTTNCKEPTGFQDTIISIIEKATNKVVWILEL